MSSKRKLTSRDRRRLWVTVSQAVLGTLAMVVVLVAGAKIRAAEPATAYVESMAVRAINVLSDGSLPADQRRGRFGKLILQAFDVNGIAAFVMGPYWAKASPAQKKRFKTVFKRALVQTYTDRFFDYDGQSLRTTGTAPASAGSIIVKSTVKTPTGSDVYDVRWVVTGVPNHLRFFDAIIDGVSTTLTTKQDYASVLRSNGGKVDALIALLEAKTQ